jgi:hypothetical protein
VAKIGIGDERWVVCEREMDHPSEKDRLRRFKYIPRGWREADGWKRGREAKGEKHD